jgi:DNA-binding IclR family transcriptional regulator
MISVPKERTQTDGAQSIKRAFAILRIVVAHGGAGAALRDVTAESSLHRATAHRILSALVDEGVLEFNESTRRYRLGVEIFAFGAAMGDRFDIRNLAAPSLQELCEKTRDTAYLGVRSGYDGLCIDIREGNYPIKTLRLHIHDRWPLGIGAFSMPLLAWLPDSEIAEIVSHNAAGLADEKEHTPEILLRRVEETRKRGYAVNYITTYPGMCGVGVPILDQHHRPIASLCVVALIRRMNEARQVLIARAMWAKSKAIAELWRSVREVKGSSKGWIPEAAAPQQDLGSNPKHLKDFGRAPRRNR